jgi:hypothetical protein
MSVGKFGLCCCHAQPGIGEAAIIGDALGFGNSIMPNSASPEGCTPGQSQRYLSISSMTSFSDPRNPNTVPPWVVSGFMTWDIHNGAIIAHGITPSGYSDVLYPNNGVIPFGGGPNVIYTNTGTSATWVLNDPASPWNGTLLQSIQLSQPQTIFDLRTIATGLLNELDVTTVPIGVIRRRRWNFEEAATFYQNNSPPGGNLWGGGLFFPVESQADPGSGGPILQYWGVVLDADVLAFASSKLTDDVNIGLGHTALTFYSVCGTENEYFLSTRLFQPFPPGSAHCYDDQRIDSSGTSDSCGAINADGSGRVILVARDLVPDSVSTTASITRSLFPNQHPSGAPGGCPCA